MPIALVAIVGVLISTAIEVLVTSGRWLEGWVVTVDMLVLRGVNADRVPVLQRIILPQAAVLLTQRRLRS